MPATLPINKTVARSAGLALAGTLLLVLAGCMSTEPKGPSAADVSKSDSVSATGKTKLDAAFERMSSGGFLIGEDDDSEMRDANAAFAQALALNPNNKEARLGFALTSTLLALQSPQLKDLVDESTDTPSPLDVNFSLNAPLARMSVLAKVSAGTRPQIHELQDAVADTLLPALEAAIDHLTVLNSDPSFTMMMTIDGSQREIDHAEIAVLLAGFKTLHALATLVLSYDLDYDHNGSYDYLDVISDIDDWDNLSTAEVNALNTLTGLFNKNGPFLAVRPAWSTRLAQVDNNILDALAILKEGLVSIKTEADPQSDDLLRRCSIIGTPQGSCISISNINNLATDIDSTRKYITQPYPIAFADTTIRVNLAAWLSVQDYKKLQPHYAFYNAGVWSSEKPVYYFTTPQGVETGNLKTVNNLLDRAYDQNWTAKKTVDSLKVVIRWQDPTFQGFLPGATEARVWRLLEIAMDAEDQDDVWALSKTDGVATRSLRTTGAYLDPRLPLRLLGK